jgi:AGZA family xanthine/uracil permease-like MFS transporter
MMLSSFSEINWGSLEAAIPAFFVGIVMALCYSITNGIAAGFIFYCLITLIKKIFGKETEKLHPVLIVSTLLFILNFVISAQ